MRYAALSDLHLGFRGMGRTEAGRNVREMDVERAWFAAVDEILARTPDLVTIAGDVFHSVRPSFHAVRAFQMGVERLADEGIQVVVIGGNHESPRTAEALTPNVVVEGLARVVTQPCRQLFRFGPENVSVACLPFVGLGKDRIYEVAPDPDADVNVLLLHAAVQTSAVEGALPRVYGGAAAYDVGREAEKWDVIACGDYHEFTRLHPTRAAFYSGSLERTSSNIWQETQPKGFVYGDTATGTFEFVETSTRPMCDATATYRGTPALNAKLAALLEVPARDMLFRLRVDGFPRAECAAVGWAQVSALKDRHVLFHLDLRYAERDVRDLGDRRERGDAPTLGDMAEEFFAEDEEAVREAAMQYLGMELVPLT